MDIAEKRVLRRHTVALSGIVTVDRPLVKAAVLQGLLQEADACHVLTQRSNLQRLTKFLGMLEVLPGPSVAFEKLCYLLQHHGYPWLCRELWMQLLCQKGQLDPGGPALVEMKAMMRKHWRDNSKITARDVVDLTSLKKSESHTETTKPKPATLPDRHMKGSGSSFEVTPAAIVSDKGSSYRTGTPRNKIQHAILSSQVLAKHPGTIQNRLQHKVNHYDVHIEVQKSETGKKTEHNACNNVQRSSKTWQKPWNSWESIHGSKQPETENENIRIPTTNTVKPNGKLGAAGKSVRAETLKKSGSVSETIERKVIRQCRDDSRRVESLVHGKENIVPAGKLTSIQNSKESSYGNSTSTTKDVKIVFQKTRDKQLQRSRLNCRETCEPARRREVVPSKTSQTERMHSTEDDLLPAAGIENDDDISFPLSVIEMKAAQKSITRDLLRLKQRERTVQKIRTHSSKAHDMSQKTLTPEEHFWQERNKTMARCRSVGYYYFLSDRKSARCQACVTAPDIPPPRAWAMDSCVTAGSKTKTVPGPQLPGNLYDSKSWGKPLSVSPGVTFDDSHCPGASLHPGQQEKRCLACAYANNQEANFYDAMVAEDGNHHVEVPNLMAESKLNKSNTVL